MGENKYSQVSHVIFDMDGLILDTERLYSEANGQVLAKYGKEFTWEVKRQQMGRKKHEAVNVLVDMLELPLSVEEYASETDKVLIELLPTAQLLPGAEKLIRHLHQKTALFDLFLHGVLCGDDPEVGHGKPDPECFHVCASRFTPPPGSTEEVLVFEDAPNGVEAAVAARMQVVMVPDPRVEKEYKDMATLCLDSLEDFDPTLFGLPPF